MTYELCSCGVYQKLKANPKCPECTSKGQKVKVSKAKPKQEIKKQSPKAKKQESELSRIKKELLAENPVCFSSGETSSLTLSHIIPKTCKAFATFKGNLVLENLEVHTIYEHNKKLFAELYPRAWKEKLKRAKAMSKEHYEKLIQHQPLNA
ncbi:hypothetical protein Q4E40_02865 [Pontibacter sp. BT731]|uniref:hypothetical protein n=1 Tax=Pontibacter coccineus TaxID=3063328 RepID=UPI0026E1AE4A|nr:hypothetical protein [Pontibacter sp. BT731]MDO6389055.1 hypothetical protein [Pontibacter sp. BT731]